MDRTGSSMRTIYGIPIERIEELIGLFREKGYDLKSDKDFKAIKVSIFCKVEEETK